MKELKGRFKVAIDPAMSYPSGKTRILALNPGSKEIGFALLSGDTLVRYGVRNIKRRSVKQANGWGPGTDLIESFKPDIVVIGKLSHLKRSHTNLKNLTNQIKRFAQRERTRVQEIELAEARNYLIKDMRPTKMNVAGHISSVYPELSPYLPQKGRILWTPKDKYWMNMFDALTLGLYCLRKRNTRKQHPNIKGKTI